MKQNTDKFTPLSILTKPMSHQELFHDETTNCLYELTWRARVQQHTLGRITIRSFRRSVSRRQVSSRCEIAFSEGKVSRRQREGRSYGGLGWHMPPQMFDAPLPKQTFLLPVTVITSSQHFARMSGLKKWRLHSAPPHTPIFQVVYIFRSENRCYH